MADALLGGVVINEILVDPNSNGGLNFDTEGNETAASTDEYLELYDISGVQLWDAGVGNWFTLPSGTILAAVAMRWSCQGCKGLATGLIRLSRMARRQVSQLYVSRAAHLLQHQMGTGQLKACVLVT